MDEIHLKKRRLFWLKVLAGVCLFVVTAPFLLGIYLRGFTDMRQVCNNEKSFLRKLACGLSETYEDCAPYFRSLPTDEQMISNFNKHRADFERLVHIYREDMSVPTDIVGYLLPNSDLQAIMNRINVASIRSDRTIWMPPNPYSIEPDFLKGMAVLRGRSGVQARKYSGVIFNYAHDTVYSLRYLAPVCKGYYYTPFVPRVTEGLLRTPEDAGKMLPTLNSYPPVQYWGECFYRQIAEHWFIRFCQDK